LKACYIDIDDDQEEKDNEEIRERSSSGWSNLPDLLLEEIFNYLNLRERYYVSMVSPFFITFLPYITILRSP
jgi:F-box protein 39